MNPDVRHAYGLRAWIRVHLPFWLIDLGVASKGRDCEAVGGDHHWYNIDGKCSACYYCRVVQRGQLWRGGTA